MKNRSNLLIILVFELNQDGRPGSQVLFTSESGKWERGHRLGSYRRDRC